MSSVLNTAVQTGTGFSQQTSALRDVYSAEIWFAALPVLRFDQFTTKKTELGTQSGATIQMPKYGNIKRGGRLTEGVRVQTVAMSLTQQAVTVYEMGNAIGFSEYLLQTSFYDQMAAGSLLLGRDMAVVLDMYLRNAAVGGANVIYAGGKSARNQLVLGDNFDFDLISKANEVLQTNNAPRWGGQYYIGFVHPHQAARLRRDPSWVAANVYSNAQALYLGEIGMIEGIRFIETSVMPNGANGTVNSATGDVGDVGFNQALAVGTAGNQTTIYQAVIFGEWSVAHATGLPVELRDNGVQDFGREHGLMWYSIWGQGTLEPMNLVVLETA